jgi:hypothetical protein
MLVQDMLTGSLHEVPDGGVGYAEAPDPRLYGLGEVHDGFGNSLGMFLLPKLISRLVGGAGSSRPAVSAPSPACPPCPACPSCGMQLRPPFPLPFPYPPPPPGYPSRRRRRRR